MIDLTKRVQAVFLFRKSVPNLAIANKLGVHRATVNKWSTIFAASGLQGLVLQIPTACPTCGNKPPRVVPNNCQRGQALIEAAFGCLILALLLTGGISLMLLMQQSSTVKWVAEQGAMCAESKSGCDPVVFIQNAGPKLGLSSANLTVVYTPPYVTVTYVQTPIGNLVPIETITATATVVPQ